MAAALRPLAIKSFAVIKMIKANKMKMEWKLSCSQPEAIQRLAKSLDSKGILRWYKISGQVGRTEFSISTKTPGMRGFSIAFCYGNIVKDDNNQCRIIANIGISWPFKYFKLNSKLLTCVVIIAILSWCFCLVSVHIPSYFNLLYVFEPVGFLCIATL